MTGSGQGPLLLDNPIEGVRRITLHRPDRLNAMTCEMIDMLVDEIERIHFDPEVRVVIVTAAGRGFCSGADLSGTGRPRNMPIGIEAGSPQYARYFLQQMERIPKGLRALPQPVICAVNGVAAGAGYSLALACDMTIAAQSARFVNAIHNAATGCEFGMSYLLPRAVGLQKAAEILFTQRPVGSEEAERIGLVLKTVPDEALMDEALALARDMIVNVPLGLWVTKQALWANQSAGSLDAAIEFEHRGVYIAQASEDAREKLASYLEKRPPVFRHR